MELFWYNIREMDDAALVHGYANYDDNMPHEEYAKWQHSVLE